MEAIVNHLRRGDVPLKTLCATALFKVRMREQFFIKVPIKVCV